MPTASRTFWLWWYLAVRKPQHGFASTVISGQLFLVGLGDEGEEMGNADLGAECSLRGSSPGAQIWRGGPGC